MNALRLVASNPDVPKASETERVVRRLQFVDADLKHRTDSAIGAEVRRKLGAAMQILRAWAEDRS